MDIWNNFNPGRVQPFGFDAVVGISCGSQLKHELDKDHVRPVHQEMGAGKQFIVPERGLCTELRLEMLDCEYLKYLAGCRISNLFVAMGGKLYENDYFDLF